MERATNILLAVMVISTARVIHAIRRIIRNRSVCKKASEATDIASSTLSLVERNLQSWFTRLFARRSKAQKLISLCAFVMATAIRETTIRKTWSGEPTQKTKQIKSVMGRLLSAHGKALLNSLMKRCESSVLRFPLVFGIRRMPHQCSASLLRELARSLAASAGNILPNSLHGKGAWERNDRVWVLEFKRV